MIANPPVSPHDAIDILERQIAKAKNATLLTKAVEAERALDIAVAILRAIECRQTQIIARLLELEEKLEATDTEVRLDG